MALLKVSVFCSSSSLVNENFIRETDVLARNLVNEGFLIQYGGGGVGLMGRLADTVLSLNGKIRGIIPKFMVDEGWVHHNVTDMIVVNDMYDRKKKIMTETDAIIALPGGCGTLEELTEAITLKQLGIISVPIIILNTGDFYNHLIRLFQIMMEENFFRKEHSSIWQIVDKAENVVSAIKNSTPWDPVVARNSAAI